VSPGDRIRHPFSGFRDLVTLVHESAEYTTPRSLRATVGCLISARAPTGDPSSPSYQSATGSGGSSRFFAR
jgi:hypothetical protein